MTNALKNQALSTYSGAITRPAAQKPQPGHAESARTDVIATNPLTPQGNLEKQARTLIGTTFYATMLKQMRDSPFKSDLFSGGKGGQAFAGLYDQQLANHMAQKSGNKLTRPIVKKYQALADAAYKKQQKAAGTMSQEARYVAHGH